MELIEWDESYSVGVEMLDLQHKRLIAILNELFLYPDADVYSEVITGILAKLTQYASEHFNMEEALLKQYGYPCLEEHTEEHLNFHAKVASLCYSAMNRDDKVPGELCHWLKGWLMEHILVSDMAYKDFFAQKGVK